MNISVINLKSIIVKFIKLLALGVLTIFAITIFKQAIFKENMIGKLAVYDYTKILNAMLLIETESTNKNLGKYVISSQIVAMNMESDETEKVVMPSIEDEKLRTEIPEVKILKTAQTEEVSEKNIVENYNVELSTVKIRNECDYEITEELLNVETILTNKKDILIYHTHTCESYTPTDNYNYEMTGNYRTTDNNYNVVKVGTELQQLLTSKGFNVKHNTTCHDYPSYSGSYTRSLISTENSLYGTNTQLVFDIHRDAIGDGATYGPTIKVNENKVAQLMFVIGTNGGGLEHENWVQNLKIAMQIQQKANEIYPGLFRPIIIRNSRYNQHLAMGASIIEVGATGNTMEECLLSMQCLANVLEEFL